MEHLDPDTISAYIDEELSASDAAQVEDHLASCEACAHEYRETLAVARLVRQLPVYASRSPVTIEAQLRPRATAFDRIVEFSKPLAVAAIVLIVAFAGLRVVDDLVTGDSDDDAPLGELAAPTVDEGTDSRLPTSESVAADAAAPDNQGEAPQAALPPNRAMQQTSEAEFLPGDAAPAAEEQTEQAAAAEPTPSVAEPEETDDEGNVTIIIGVAISVVVIAVIGGAIWFFRSRSSRA